MLLQLREFAALPEEFGSISRPMWRLATFCDSSCRRLDSSSALYGHQAFMWYTGIRAGKNPIHIK